MRKYGAVIAIAVLALLIGVYFFVTNYLASREEAPSDKDYVSYYTASINNIQSVNVVNGTGEFTFAKDEDSKWYLSENKGIELVQSAVSSFVVSMTFFDGELIAQDGYNPSDYGLDKPSAVVTLTDSDGKTDIISIGNLASTSEVCYVTVNDGPVYSAFSTKYDNAIQELGKFRPTTFYDFDSTTLNSVHILDAENGEIEIVAKDPQKNDISITGWQMTKPFYKDIYNSTLGDFMVNPLNQGVPIVRYVSDNPADLSLYGLDKPHERVTIDTDREVVTFIFGKTDGENVYVMKQGFSTVYLVSDETFAFRNKKPFDYVNKLVNVVNINDLDNLTVTTGSEKYVLGLSEGKYTINSKSIEKESVKSFYESLMLLSVRGVLDSKPEGQAAYTFEYNRKNGQASVVKLIPYKERFYAAWVDGVMDFYVNKADVESVEKKLSALGK